MERGYRYRIYPTDEPKVLMAKTFGCVRFVYNWGLDLKQKLWKEELKNLSEFDLVNLLSRELKKEHEWLREVNSESLSYALRQMIASYNNFFRGTARFPNFKTKFGEQKFNNPRSGKVDFASGRLEIPKFRGKNSIKCIFHRRFTGTVKRITITKECDGRYYATILVDDNFNALPPRPITEDSTIGIDTGIKSFAVLSTGEEIPTPHFSKNEKAHLARLQQSLSRKQKGSANYGKAKLRVARVHSRIKHKREDFLHKLTHRLTHENQVSQICVEDLNVKGMTQNHHLAYSIADAGLGEFYRQLEYKCKWYGVGYRVIDRFAPSSKLCHVCGYKKTDMKLSIRQWTCPECGTHHDRDVNAAINIKHIGIRALPMLRGEVKPVEKPTMDDRALHLKSSAPVKQEKSRSKYNSEAAKSLA